MQCLLRYRFELALKTEVPPQSEKKLFPIHAHTRLIESPEQFPNLKLRKTVRPMKSFHHHASVDASLTRGQQPAQGSAYKSEAV